jgi:hypothetical protein
MPLPAERVDLVLGVVTPAGGVLAHLTVPADAGGRRRLQAFARTKRPAAASGRSRAPGASARA